MNPTIQNQKNPVRIGILLEPLMEICSHPDRNNLIRVFFTLAEEKSISLPVQKKKTKRHYTTKRRIVPVSKFPQPQQLSLYQVLQNN